MSILSEESLQDTPIAAQVEADLAGITIIELPTETAPQAPVPPPVSLDKPRRAASTRSAGSSAKAPAKEPVGRHGTGKEKVPPVTAQPPNFREWHGFISTVAIRWLARGFTAWAFRGIPNYESLLTREQLEDIELDDKQLSAIAKPLAHMAMRSEFMNKHGRAIIDSADGIEALVVLVMWSHRVNRIAASLRPKETRHDHGLRGRGRGNRESRPGTNGEAGPGQVEPAESGRGGVQEASFSPNGQYGGIGAGYN